MHDSTALYDQALSALDRCDWGRALESASHAARLQPTHADAHFVAGISALQLFRMRIAISHLRAAAGLAPGRVDVLAQLVRALVMSGEKHEARHVADRAMALEGDDAMALDTLGVAYGKLGVHDAAREAFQRAVAQTPDSASRRFNLGTAHLFAGDIDLAEREFEACVTLEPCFWRAHLAISQLRVQTPGRHHLERLGALLSGHAGDAEARLHLHAALAKELEDLGEHGTAFGHYTAGKAIRLQAVGSSAQRDACVFDAIRDWYEALPARPSPGHDSGEPIFVMGMPRTGTTLVDRILSRHPDVSSAGELAAFPAAVAQSGGGSVAMAPDAALAALGPGFDRWEELGRRYIANTRPGTGHAPRFVDKLPHNFLYAGLIAQALPRARLVCLRRDPMDTCLSNFRQLFAFEARQFDYANDLLDTGRYYLHFDRLMRFWQEVLPDRIFMLDYEALVEDQATTTRALLDFCQLPWNDACLSFERGGSAVATASAAQVRHGLNRDSMGRWRRYGSWLDPLRTLLEEGGISFEGE